jgi:general L-amino acid transport system permease protein
LGVEVTASTFLRRCVSSPLNVAITAAIVVWLGTSAPGMVRWALVDAVWTGESPRSCANIDAACWLFIRERLGQLAFGRRSAGA